MGIEYERKFRATESVLEEIRNAFSEEEQVYKMETTYYDAPDKALSDRWYTLRRRMENDRCVCTLKAPVSQRGRGEWEVDCDDIEKAILELCKLGAPKDLILLTRGGVMPICGAKFTRIAKTLVLENCTVELALDKGILFGGGKEIPLCEVEVELKDGTTDSCDAFARTLADRFSLEKEEHSKFRRALALYEGA